MYEFTYPRLTRALFWLPQAMIGVGFVALLWILSGRHFSLDYVFVVSVWEVIAIISFLSLRPLLSYVPSMVAVEDDLVSLRFVHGFSKFKAIDIVSIDSDKNELDTGFIAGHVQVMSGWMVIRYKRNGDVATCYIHPALNGFMTFVEILMSLAPGAFKCERSEFLMPTRISPFLMAVVISVVISIWGLVLLPEVLYVVVPIVAVACATWYVSKLTTAVRLTDEALCIRYVSRSWIELPWCVVLSVDRRLKAKSLEIFYAGGFAVTTTTGHTYWIPPYLDNYFELIVCVVRRLQGRRDAVQ